MAASGDLRQRIHALLEVKLRYFAGTSLEETAQLLGISPAAAKRHWVYARSWLYGKLHGD